MTPFWVDRKYATARRWSNDELRRIAPHFTGDIANFSGWDDRDKQGRKYRGYFAGVKSRMRRVLERSVEK